MAMKIKKSANRGFVNNIILESLIHGDKYGYEIIKEVEEKSEGRIVLKQPSLYSSLKRFETKGYITSYWGDSDIGGRRHYYTITEMGRAYFAKVQSGSALDLDEEDENETPVTNVTLDEIEKNENSTTQVSAPSYPDVESEDYDVFELLNKPANFGTPENKEESKSNASSSVAIQFNMFHQPEPASEPLLPEEDVNKNEIEKVKQADDGVVQEQLDLTTAPQNSAPQKSIPLIEEKGQNFNWDELKTQLVLKAQNESKKINTEIASDAEENFNSLTSLETVVTPNSSEDNKEKVKPQKPLKVVVDEFGIMKSDNDTMPRKPKSIIDNVGMRIDSKDPVEQAKARKSVKEKAHEINFEINTAPVAEFNEQVKIVSDKLNKAVMTHKRKTDGLNLKNIMGDMMVDDNQIPTISAKVEPATAPSEEVQMETKLLQSQTPQWRATSYSALEDNLGANGFKFKPYQYEVGDSDGTSNYVLINKLKFHFGFVMLFLMALQLSIMVIVLKAISYPFKNIDLVVIGICYGIAGLVMVAFWLPYFINGKKRKQNTYNLGQNMLFGFLIALSLCIVVYAVNSFLGLSFQNITDYLVTLFMPMLGCSGLVVAPLAYRVLLNSRKFY